MIVQLSAENDVWRALTFGLSAHDRSLPKAVESKKDPLKQPQALKGFVCVSLRKLIDRSQLAGNRDEVQRYNSVLQHVEADRVPSLDVLHQLSPLNLNMNVLLDDNGAEGLLVKKLDGECSSSQGCTLSQNALQCACRRNVSD